MKISLSLIVLTYNEEINLERCLKNVENLAEEIIVVDSFSTDKTLEIAEKYGAKIFQHHFKNQADQFNWALDNLEIKSQWILRLDADEYLTEELKKEITHRLSSVPEDIKGFLIKRRVYFMGRWIKHGGYYPFWLLRLFRNGSGRYQEKEMDEHISLEGGVVRLKNDFVDDNKKDLNFWINKHIAYAEREARDILSKKHQKYSKSLYLRLPRFLRVFLYFFYRYFLRLGFLDGIPGLVFHFLQGFWYRFLVDVKLFEMGKNSNNNE